MATAIAEPASAIVDRIYEAAFIPEGWPKALEAISDLSGSASGQFFLLSENSPVRGSTQENLRPLFDEFVSGDAWKISDSVQKMYAAQPASFVVVDDFMSAEQIEQDPVRIKLRAFGIGQHLCAAVPLPSGDLATFVFQRWLKDGRYGRASIDLLDGIRPHLARAGLIAGRLRLEQAQATVSALREIGLPAAVIEASGRVLATNDLIEGMADVLLPAARGRMAVADRPADLLFQQAIAQNRHHGVVRSIPVRRSEGRPAIVLHVVPLRRAALDIFSGADILVAATVPTPTAMVPSVSLLTSLFDLTPAEVRVFQLVVEGHSNNATAEALGVLPSTVKTHLLRVFDKTGVRTRVGIANLAHKITLPG